MSKSVRIRKVENGYIVSIDTHRCGFNGPLPIGAGEKHFVFAEKAAALAKVGELVELHDDDAGVLASRPTFDPRLAS